MPAELHINRAALVVRVTIPDLVLKQYFSSSVGVLGEQIAQQVNDHVQATQSGYYPPLDYVQEHHIADDYLLDAIEEVSRVVVSYTQQKVAEELQPVFSSVKILSIQLTAFTMPGARPGQSDALELLSLHYTPNRVKLDLEISLIQKQEQKTGLEKMAESMVRRWLETSFENIETGAARLLVK